MLRLIIILSFFIFIRSLIQYIAKVVGFINNKQHTNNTYQHNHYYKSSNKNTIQDLIQCEYCGLYVPSSDCIDYYGKKFCCKEHIH
jgi:hypothetical protein